MNNISTPSVIKANPPTFTRPLLEKMSQSRLSFSFGSGLCSQSSFSTSSGKSSKPADGKMLYFSETVCVFTPSSSLPAREGALESSNGDANGPYRLSRLPIESELQLVLLDESSEGDRIGDGDSSSRYRRDRVLLGCNNSSADSAGWL